MVNNHGWTGNIRQECLRDSGSMWELMTRYGIVCGLRVGLAIFSPILSKILADRNSHGERFKDSARSIFYSIFGKISWLLLQSCYFLVVFYMGASVYVTT